MDLKQYKMIRTNKFPLPVSKSPTKTQPKSQNIYTYALVSGYQPQTYEVHINSNQNGETNVIMFNDHQYVKRKFSWAFKVEPDNNEEVFKEVIGKIQITVSQNNNNLFICNALELDPIDKLIFPIKKHIEAKKQNQNKQNSSEKPQSMLRGIIKGLLNKKADNTIITLSVIAIRADGTLGDQLNYEWINESEYVQDLIKIKEKTKLKVKKYKSEIKTFDLNRQQIKAWEEGEQILTHYFQIKDYLQAWNEQQNPGTSPKIGQIYQLCETEIDEEEGYIKQIHKRNCLVKLNQFMKQSNLVSMKISQQLKDKVNQQESAISRDLPVIMFLRSFFIRQIKSSLTLITQIGVCSCIKEQSMCLSMDLHIPGTYTYLKNYKDRPEIIKEIKQISRVFLPLTNQQKVGIKVSTLQTISQKINTKAVKLIRESERVASKSFFFDTYSSNEKKNEGRNTTLQVETVMVGKKQTLPQIYGSKPSSSLERSLPRKQNASVIQK